MSASYLISLESGRLAGRPPSHLLNPEVMEGFSWEGKRPETSGEEKQRLSAKDKPTVTF